MSGWTWEGIARLVLSGVEGAEVGDGVDIKDERDASVAEDGGPGEEALRFESVAERFDDDFLFAEHFVYEEAAREGAGFRDDDDAFGRTFRAGIDAEEVAETGERHEFAAHADEFASALDCGDLGVIDAEAFADGEGGEDESFASDGDEQSVDDGEGEGEEDGERGALAEDGIDFDASAEARDVASHDVHTDAASGDFRDFFSG
ncbi:MAG: hypothetical protein RIS92_3178 [Verrucomicrobiota bacterium]